VSAGPGSLRLAGGLDGADPVRSSRRCGLAVRRA